MPLDHVLFAAEDLELASAAMWHDHGLWAVEGGRHPAWGTANWIVPLGSTYLELVGIADKPVAGANAFGRRVGAAIETGGSAYAWCVRPVDLDATAARLGLKVASGSRHRPDGQIVSWRMAGLDTALRDPSRPFFIDWTVVPSLHPGQSEARHRTAAPTIGWIEIAGDPGVIRSWLGDDDVPVIIRRGDPSVVAIGIASGGREIVLH